MSDTERNMDSENEEKRESSPVISLPEGFAVPEGTKEGGEFDVVCTFKAVGPGKAELLKVGDKELKCDKCEDKPKDSPAPGYGKLADSIIGGMGATGMAQ